MHEHFIKPLEAPIDNMSRFVTQLTNRLEQLVLKDEVLFNILIDALVVIVVGMSPFFSDVNVGLVFSDFIATNAICGVITEELILDS